MHPKRPSLLAPSTLIALSTSLCLFACGGGGGGGSSSSGSSTGGVRSTTRAVAATTEMALSGRYLAYIADEATTGVGEFLNGDNDKIDGVVSLVEMSTFKDTNLGVAARDIVWAESTLFMAVNESEDGFDWDEDGATGAGELSLVYWQVGVSTEPEFVASMDAEGPCKMVAVGSRLFFTEDIVGQPGLGSTTLRRVKASIPDVAIPIGTPSQAAGGLQPRILGEDEGLVFLALDEDSDGDLNDDGDDEDDTVLALLNGLSGGGAVLVTGLAMDDEDAPLRARASGPSDWLVGFLVDEESHVPTPDIGFTGFNDPQLFAGTWRPVQCAGPRDTDRDDEVLHYIRFADWVSDPVLNPPRNTGLVGEDRVVAVDRYVGTISDEDDDDCDLNGDGNTNDRVFRWVEAVGGNDPILPPGDENADLIALVDDDLIPGGTYGVAELEGRFVALFSEDEDETNYDGDAGTEHDLLAWRDPAVGGSAWRFDHGTGSAFFGGATWMDETPERDRLLVAAPEKVFDQNLNIPPGAIGPDTDKNDSIPSFNRFLANRFVFEVVRVAVDTDDAGMAMVDGAGFYRVSEQSDSRDWTGDNDRQDQVLFATNSSLTGFISALNNIPGSSAVVYEEGTATPFAVAFIAREGMTGIDYNFDGDTSDLVVRYFGL